MGAVILSLGAALVGSTYTSMQFGLGFIEAFALYVALGTLIMSLFMLMSLTIGSFRD